MNIRFKITLLFTLLVMALLSLLSFSIFYFSSLERENTFRTRLKGRANGAVQLYLLFGDSSIRILNRLDSTSQIVFPKKFVVLYDKGNKLVYKNASPGFEPLNIDSQFLQDTKSAGELSFRKDSLDVFTRYYHDSLHSMVVVYVAYDEEGWKRLVQLRKILLISLLVGVVITMVVGYLFSTQLVRPINRIIREVNDISSQNLSHRIYSANRQDELSRLSNTFNGLLARLQDAFIMQRRFISNASHELSTPLTSISSQLQVTLHKERSSEEYQSVLHSIQEDVDQMGQLTKSLLEIAKAGFEGGIELKEVRIDEIIFKIVADVKKISLSYEVNLEFGDFPDDEKSCMAYGNSDLLYSALKNIVENGCKFSPDKTSNVHLFFKGKNILVEVRNQGDIIAEEEMENIFHPFYRAATATETKGFGLGLALSKRIISLHKGEIKVKSDVLSGTLFSICLPSLSHYYQN